jgi:hypothetical protein
MPIINYVAAVVLSIIVLMILEEVYYSIGPIRRPWMRLAGLGEAQVSELKARMKKVMGFFVLASAVTVVTMIVVFTLVGVTTAKEGAVLGALFAVGFFSTVRLVDYSISGKSKGLVLIESGCSLLQYAAAGAIVGAFL